MDCGAAALAVEIADLKRREARAWEQVREGKAPRATRWLARQLAERRRVLEYEAQEA